MEMSASGNKWVGLKGISFSEILQLIHLEMWDVIIGIRLHGWNLFVSYHLIVSGCNEFWNN